MPYSTLLLASLQILTDLPFKPKIKTDFNCLDVLRYFVHIEKTLQNESAYRAKYYYNLVTMPYLIDGHNLIPKIPGLSLGDIDDEIQLVKLLQDFSRKQRKRVEVYFDKAPPGTQRTRIFGTVTAHFIREGITADSAIQSRLRKMGRAAQNWTVVTSDREISAAVREVGARLITSETFTQNLFSSNSEREFTSETDPDLALNPDAVDDWLKIFGVDNGEE